MIEIAALCLALNVYYEAGIQPDKGKWSIAELTMTRVKKSSHKPQTGVCNIVLEPKQFSWANSFSRKKPAQRITYLRKLEKRLQKEGSPSWNRSVEIATLTLEGVSHHYVGNADYFYNRDLDNPKWRHKMKYVATIYNHVFMESKERI